MVNELALMCRDLDVDVWEVIDAARTKPFGFMPFYPGPGLGGHGIPVDPFYLGWKARQHGFEPRFIELAGQVNGVMPRYVVDRMAEALNTRSRAVRGSRIHLFGMEYRANVSVVRESPALDIADLLLRRGAVVSYSDPFVPIVKEGTVALEAIAPAAALAAGIDCAVITTAHHEIDYADTAHRSPLVVDTRNALRGVEGTYIFVCDHRCHSHAVKRKTTLSGRSPTLEKLAACVPGSAGTPAARSSANWPHRRRTYSTRSS